MNKKDKIEARKAIFDKHKVFILCTFVYTNMVINYVNFNFFEKNIEIKKNVEFRVRVRLRIRFRLRVRSRVRFRVSFRVRVLVGVRFRVLAILPIFGPFFKFSLIKSAFRALILSYYLISDHILSF
jgi:hypothetical protein